MGTADGENRSTFYSCSFLIILLQLCHLLSYFPCPLHPSDTLYHNEIFCFFKVMIFFFSLQDKTSPHCMNTFWDPFLSIVYYMFLILQVFQWPTWTIRHFTPRPRNFLQRITPALGNCSNVKRQPGSKCNEDSVATERSGYLSPAKWKSWKLEFGRAALEQGPRATLPRLMNAEGKPQMFANITIGGKREEEPDQYCISEAVTKALVWE